VGADRVWGRRKKRAQEGSHEVSCEGGDALLRSKRDIDRKKGLPASSKKEKGREQKVRL